MYQYSQGNFAHPLCNLSLGSMTQAIKARRLLSARGIEVKVKKIGERNASRGCVYGIEYPCSLSGNLRAILRESGFKEF